MRQERIGSGAYELTAGIARVYLIENKGVLTLINTGIPGRGDLFCGRCGFGRQAFGI